VPFKPEKPVLVKRRMKAGHVYSTHLERLDSGLTLVIDAVSTVDTAADANATFTLLVDNLTFANKHEVRMAKFKVTADFTNSALPDVDAKQTGGDPAELHLTDMEHVSGDLCGPPAEAHLPGDSWTDKEKRTWKFVAYEKEGAAEYATFHCEEKQKDMSWISDMRLRTDDGYAGTCHAVNAIHAGALNTLQDWKLRVKDAPHE
jgi:hypothetical protein